MLFSRIRCHFCGSKQPHSKSVTEFQCSECEAFNYFDGKGNVVDTPAHVADPPTTHQDTSSTKHFLSFTKPPPESLHHHQNQPFCRTCQQNQHLYNRILAEYLPDEAHPEYRAKLRYLPQRKAELEKEYPQICKKCAANAQAMINRADYYAMSQNASKLVSETHRRKGRAALRTRDTTSKKFTRNAFRLIALILNIGLMFQVVFHLYGILATVFGKSAPDADAGIEDLLTPTFRECAREGLFFDFNGPCYDLISSIIPSTLTLATIFIWFNPGLKEWYHHTYRIEAIEGQKSYFYMQLIILAIRVTAWFNLSSPKYTATLDKEHVVAMHGFAILFMLVTQAVATKSITLIRWTIKGKIMPKPDEKDIFSATAGPAVDHYTPKASSKDPWKYLRREDNGPFDINSLAPKTKQTTLPPPSYLNYPPSPEFSDCGDPDAMETDYRPVMRSAQLMNTRPNLQPRHTYMNHANAPALGFSDVRNELFGMEDQMRQEEERKRLEAEQKLHYEPPRKQSPFYGSLPPAPMSMERRLRNPVLRQAEPQQVPLSQQKDFMAQMRRGVKPVQFPEKGTNFELKKSNWVLPGDVKTTGIEDRFTRSFTLDDESPGQQQKKGLFGSLFG